MKHLPALLSGTTTHTRLGAIRNRFCYAVDYVLLDPEAPMCGTWLFSRNRFNLVSVHDCDHGGPLKQGRGAAWAREVLSGAGLIGPGIRLMLLTQPRFLGYTFNPVSFWLAMRDNALVAVISEVSTPFGDRHSYICHQRDFRPISAEEKFSKPKHLHVSPFQEVAGGYEFTFDIRPDQIDIRILHRNGNEGVMASLSGKFRPMTTRGLLWVSLRRPFGSLRTIGLIHWQALRLKLKGAKYRPRPNPPKTEVT